MNYVAAAILFALPLAAQQVELVEGRQAVAGEVLVRYRDGASQNLKSAITRERDIRMTRRLGDTGVMHLRSGTQSTAQLIRELSREPDVLDVEPNYLVHATGSPTTTPPSDKLFSAQWNLRNTGQGGGVPQADIEAVPAWAITTGSRANIVGVLDTGIYYTHPDLAANVWSAPASFTITFGPGDSVTCPMGSHGYDAIANTCDPMDKNNHGSHVSGIIGAVGNNNLGVAGINWTASIMGLRFMDDSAVGTVANAIRAINFAVKLNKALTSGPTIRILSSSWEATGNSQALLDAINSANTAGILFVVAAGNDYRNLDYLPSYPASYNTPNEITVAATDNADKFASFSNFGTSSVHLGAPGVNIISTVTGGQGDYASWNGTSMAAPHVAGAAALILSVCSLQMAALKQTILNNVDPLPDLTTRTITGGRLNVYRAVRSCAPGYAPGFTLSATPTAVTLGPGSSVTSTIAVTASGGFTGNVTLSAIGLPTGVTAAFSPASVAPGATATLTLTASASAKIGSGDVTVNGVSGNLTGSTGLTVNVAIVPGFKLTATPPTLTVVTGSSATSTIAITPSGGFTGKVILTLSTLPAGVTVTQTPGSGAAVVLKFAAAASATPATTVVTVTGTSGHLAGTTTINLTVAAGSGFTLNAAPSSLTLTSGGATGASTISLTATGGFKGSVALSISGLPTGVTAAFSPTSIAPGATATIKLLAAATAVPGSASLTITGRSGSISNTTDLSLSVVAPAGFTLTAAPTAISLTPGSNASAAISIEATGGFSGNVTLSAAGLPAGVTAVFAPATVATGGTATLTLTAGATAAAASANVTVSGKCGTLTGSTLLSLKITIPPGFTVTASPASLNLGAGASVSTKLSITAVGGFKTAVTLAVTGLPNGVTAVFTPSTITPGATATLQLTASASAAVATTPLSVNGVSGSLSSTEPLSLNVLPAASFSLTATPPSVNLTAGSKVTLAVNVTGIGGFTGKVALSATDLPSGVTARFTPSTLGPGGSATMSLMATSATAVSTTNITVSGTSGALTVTTPVSVAITPAPGFSVSSAPPALTLAPGGSLSPVITVLGSGGFKGSVTLSISGLPAGVTAVFKPATVLPGTTSTLTVTASASAASSTSTLTVTGTSGALTARTSVNLTVATPAGFKLGAAPASVSIIAGATGTATVSLTASGGFQDNVALAVTGLPAGVTAAFSPSTIAPGVTSTLTLTAASSASLGNAVLTITGASGNLSSSALLGVVVTAPGAPGFIITVADSPMTILWGTLGTTTVKVIPTGGFSGNVKLSISGLPCGVQATFTPSTVAAGGSATLQINFPQPPLTTQLTVSGVSGSLSASTPFRLVVQYPQATVSLSFASTSIAVAPGASASTTISLVTGGGWTGTVDLLVLSAPKGVTATISPSSISPGATAMLTVTAAASASPPTGAIVINASMQKAVMSTSYINLNDSAPGFTFGYSIDQYYTATERTLGRLEADLEILPYGGFNSDPTFTFSGPPGVIATFSQVERSPGANNWGVRFELVAGVTAAARASTPVTITATSGTVTASTTFHISVAPGAFEIGPPLRMWSDCCEFIIPAGQSLTTSVIGSGKGGSFTVQVTGLPSTITASTVSAPPTSYGLTLTTTAQTAPGCYQPTVTGTAPGQKASQYGLFLTVTK